jgi:putative intracellular protease/amidase
MMKTKMVIIISVILLSFILSITTTEAQAAKQKVLLYIRTGTSSWDLDNRITQEVGVMINMIEEAGFKVIVASESGEVIKGNTQKLKPKVRLADVSVNDYVGIIIPCFCRGSLSYGWHASSGGISLVKEAVTNGIPVAAQKGAIIILAEAGVLAGKRYANLSNRQYWDGFKSAIYSGKGVIRDGGIITSSHCPIAAGYYGGEDGTSELTRLFIEVIKETSQ